MRFIRYFLVVVLSMLTGIVYAREVPKIKSWILNKIQIFSSQEGHLEVKARSIDFAIFPPGVELKNLKVQPLGSMASMMAPVTIDSLGLYLSATSLLAGRFEVGSITIDHPVTSFFIRKHGPELGGGGVKGAQAAGTDLFDQIINLPLRKFTITNAEIRGKIESAGLLMQVIHFGFKGEKNYKAARADIFAPDLKIKKEMEPDSLISLGLATRLIVEQNAAEVAALKISQGSNFLMAQGVGHGDTSALSFPFVDGRTVAHLDMSEVEALAKIFFPELKLPKVSGSLNFEVGADQRRGKDLHVSAQIETRDALVDKFKIGNIFTKLSLSGNNLKAKEIKVDDDGAQLRIQDLQATVGKDMKFSTRVVLDHVELKQFLSDFDVHVPLHMDIKGAVPCEGTITPDLRVECAGEVKGSNFVIYTKTKHKTIAALKEFNLTSTLVAEKDKMLFPHGILAFGTTAGIVSGLIDFDKGFLFNFHSDRLDMSDLASLADLKYQGALNISGTTSGDGHSAVMNASISSKGLWFEDYGLGDVDMDVAYERGFLKFTQIHGQAGNTTYNGQTVIQVDDDVGNHQVGISAGHFNFPQLDLSDVTQTIFSRKVTLPFTAAGVGSAELDMSGPFNLSQLSYRLRSVVNHGDIAGETFRQARVDVHGINGHALADEIFIRKGEGIFTLTGDVLPTGLMNVNVAGRNLRLGDLEHVHNLMGDLDGHLTTDMTLKGPILKPQVTLSAGVTQTTLNQQDLEDSAFSVAFTDTGMKLDGQLFNNKLATHLLYPFTDNGPFAFHFETTNWDFTTLLGIMGKTDTRDYEANLSATMDLKCENGGFWHSSGEGLIDKFYVRHGTSQMKNDGPISVKFDDGFVNVDKFHVQGDNTDVKVTGTKTRKDALNMNVSGRVDLSLLSFLTPFFREMSGEMSLSTQIGGTLLHPDLLGSAFLKKGFFRLEALPQPFEDVSADLLFSQQRILLNRLAGHFGGGNLTAGGSLTFKSLSEVPVEISGDLLNTALDVPDGLVTHGDLRFSITGNWFPYLLTGEYNIASGIYSKNFGDEETAAAGLKRSAYLPQVTLRKNFSPIEVDILTHFNKGLSIKNDLLEADLKGDLEVKGEPAHPILKGEVIAQPGGKILFRETPFNITGFDVHFNNPTENNPQVYAQGTTHVRDWDIVLLVEGTAQKYKIDLTSSPTLSEKSIISLLALGVTDEDENKLQQSTVSNLAGLTNPVAAQTNASTVQASQAGNLLLGSTINNEFKKKFGINIRLSQDVDETHNIVMPRVIAEKVWSPTITTSVSNTLGEYVTRDANVEYKLNHHFSLLGSYEGRDFDPMSLNGPTPTDSTLGTQNIFGLDLQYQMEFK